MCIAISFINHVKRFWRDITIVKMRNVDVAGRRDDSWCGVLCRETTYHPKQYVTKVDTLGERSLVRLGHPFLNRAQKTPRLHSFPRENGAQESSDLCSKMVTKMQKELLPTMFTFTCENNGGHGSVSGDK